MKKLKEKLIEWITKIEMTLVLHRLGIEPVPYATHLYPKITRRYYKSRITGTSFVLTEYH